MHVLHRPRPLHPAAITATCAALALALTLLAGTLTDLGFVAASGAPAPTAVSVNSRATEPGWNVSPFTSLLRSPIPVPWAAGAE